MVGTMKLDRKSLFMEVRDYVMITIAMLSYCIGWTVFLLPNNITTGGVPVLPLSSSGVRVFRFR